MAERMTLDMVRDEMRARENLAAVGPVKDRYKAFADAIDAHLAQPAQAVDVGAVREVVEDMRNYDADMPLAADHWIDKLTRAIGNAPHSGDAHE